MRVPRHLLFVLCCTLSCLASASTPVAAAPDVRLSEILRFYRADFLAAAPSLAAYVNRYRERTVPDSYRVEFIDYDWTVNRQ